MTARNWATIRARLILAGIPDPLRQLSLAALMDVVEHMLLEGCEDEAARVKMQTQLYTPPTGEIRAGDPLPPGFSAEEEMSAFERMLDQQAG